MGIPVIPVGVALGLLELGKLSLQIWFQAGRQAGKTKDEMDQMYNNESVDFDFNHPDTWADVPDDVPEDEKMAGGPE